MTVPKQVVKNYLTQLEKMDAWDRQRVDAYCAGRWGDYEDLGTTLHKQSKILKELRQQLVDAVEKV